MRFLLFLFMTVVFTYSGVTVVETVTAPPDLEDAECWRPVEQCDAGGPWNV